MPPRSSLLPKSNRSRALAAGGLLAALVLVFGVVRACGDGQDIDPLPDGEKRPKAISFSGKAMWNERKLGMSSVDGVELRGDVAIVAGEVGTGKGRLAVVDVRTGEPRWIVDTGSPLKGGDGAVAYDSGYRAETLRSALGSPAVYGEGGGWTVLVQYTEGERGRETEMGVAALSGKDGTVRWKRALLRPRPGNKGDDDRDKRMRVLAADERTVLTSVEAERGIDPKTIALDAATGRKSWEHEGGWAYRFAGDVVLGETRGDEPPSTGRWGKERDGAGVFALDLTTGEKKWDLDDMFEGSHLQAVAGGTAVVSVREQKLDRGYTDRRSILLDTTTGRGTGTGGEASEGGDAAGIDRLYGCADDGRTLIACPGSDGRLVTIRSGDGGLEPFITKKPAFDETTTVRAEMVRQDRIFVAASSGGERAVVDRAANRIGAAPPGEVAAVSGQAAAFRVSREGASSSGEGLVVHAAAVGAEPPEPSKPGEPELEPPRIDAAPLWTAKTTQAPGRQSARKTGLVSVESIRIAGDMIVYVGADAKDDVFDKQVVVDAATGKVRWSVREGTSIGDGAGTASFNEPYVVDVGAEWLTLVEYKGPGDQEGIAALSLKDGSVRWKKPATSGNAYSILEAADAENFAVSASEFDAPADEDELVVYATGSRRELWRKRGVEAESVGGGLVLAAESGPGEGRAREPRDLIAYGASDGERRWRLGDRYREPELLHDAGGETIVIGTADGGAVLDRATGRELARTHAPVVQCDGSGDTLIVCRTGSDTAGSDPGERAVTIQTRDGVTKVRDLLETGFFTRYGAIGDWFVAVRPAPTSRDGAEAERFLVLDGQGRLISDDLPGRPQAIGGGFAVLTRVNPVLRSGGVATFSVHRVRG